MSKNIKSLIKTISDSNNATLALDKKALDVNMKTISLLASINSSLSFNMKSNIKALSNLGNASNVTVLDSIDENVKKIGLHSSQQTKTIQLTNVGLLDISRNLNKIRDEFSVAFGAEARSEKEAGIIQRHRELTSLFKGLYSQKKETDSNKSGGIFGLIAGGLAGLSNTLLKGFTPLFNSLPKLGNKLTTLKLPKISTKKIAVPKLFTGLTNKISKLGKSFNGLTNKIPKLGNAFASVTTKFSQLSKALLNFKTSVGGVTTKLAKTVGSGVAKAAGKGAKLAKTVGSGVVKAAGKGAKLAKGSLNVVGKVFKPVSKILNIFKTFKMPAFITTMAKKGGKLLGPIGLVFTAVIAIKDGMTAWKTTMEKTDGDKLAAALSAGEAVINSVIFALPNMLVEYAGKGAAWILDKFGLKTQADTITKLTKDFDLLKHIKKITKPILTFTTGIFDSFGKVLGLDDPNADPETKKELEENRKKSVTDKIKGLVGVAFDKYTKDLPLEILNIANNVFGSFLSVIGFQETEKKLNTAAQLKGQSGIKEISEKTFDIFGGFFTDVTKGTGNMMDFIKENSTGFLSNLSTGLFNAVKTAIPKITSSIGGIISGLLSSLGEDDMVKNIDNSIEILKKTDSFGEFIQNTIAIMISGVKGVAQSITKKISSYFKNMNFEDNKESASVEIDWAGFLGKALGYVTEGVLGMINGIIQGFSDDGEGNKTLDKMISKINEDGNIFKTIGDLMMDTLNSIGDFFKEKFYNLQNLAIGGSSLDDLTKKFEASLSKDGISDKEIKERAKGFRQKRLKMSFSERMEEGGGVVSAGKRVLTGDTTSLDNSIITKEKQVPTVEPSKFEENTQYNGLGEQSLRLYNSLLESAIVYKQAINNPNIEANIKNVYKEYYNKKRDELLQKFPNLQDDIESKLTVTSLSSGGIIPSGFIAKQATFLPDRSVIVGESSGAGRIRNGHDEIVINKNKLQQFVSDAVQPSLLGLTIAAKSQYNDTQKNLMDYSVLKQLENSSQNNIVSDNSNVVTNNTVIPPAPNPNASLYMNLYKSDFDF